jgi:hypothetical protein
MLGYRRQERSELGWLKSPASMMVQVLMGKRELLFLPVLPTSR